MTRRPSSLLSCALNPAKALRFDGLKYGKGGKGLTVYSRVFNLVLQPGVFCTSGSEYKAYVDVIFF